MSINKNFVVKNGLEVSTDLILANADTNRVGIATSNPQYTLDVAGGIGVTDVYSVGLATFTNRLNVGTNGSTLTALGVGGVGIGTNSIVNSTALQVRGNTVITNGSVGIGTTNPPSFLSVTDTGTPTTGLTGCIADFSTNTDSYGQINIRNQSGGASASGDVIVTADNGSDTVNYVDLGINNSGYSVGSWSVNGANDAYLYASDGNLSIGIANPAKYLSFFAGGTLISNEKIRINPTGVGVGTTNPTSTLTVFGNTLISGITSVGSLSIGSTQVISSGQQLQNILSLDSVTTATIESAIANGPNTFTDLKVTGVSTFVGLATFNSGLQVVSGITTLGVTTATNLTLQQLNVSGLSTLGVTTLTNLTSQQLNVSGLSTFAGITTVTGATLFSKQLNVSGITTLGVTTATNLTLQQLNVSGVSTFAGVTTYTTSLFGTQASFSGVVTATSFVGSGASLTGNARNLTATIGIGTSVGVVGYGVSFLDLRGPGLSTVYYNNNVGIATIFFQGGGSGSGSASIGIGTTVGEAFPTGIVTAGNLWYNSNLGRLFIYYSDPDGSQWIDAAPFNVGIFTGATSFSLAAGSASSPSLYFSGDAQTGFFSPALGQFTVVSTGSSILNIDPSGINVTGKITCTAGATFSGVVTATDFNSLSDINYKENVNTVNNALLKVDQLRGVKFDWKESGLPSYGVIAQELEEVLPELVHGNDPKTVNYNGIIGVLIEAIKELKAEVEELKNTK